MKYVTEIFNLWPPKSEQFKTLVFYKYLDKLGDNNLLTNILITQKRFVLLLILEAHRLSTIFMFTTDIVTLNDMSVNFLLYKVLKPSRKDRPLGKFEYRAYKDEKFGQEKNCLFPSKRVAKENLDREARKKILCNF